MTITTTQKCDLFNEMVSTYSLGEGHLYDCFNDWLAENNVTLSQRDRDQLYTECLDHINDEMSKALCAVRGF